ncbi:right-handed parallel beta-helix repeat-containing protein [Roseiconus lacunae]|uniref:right-handed parallel beta-helix repeat-containing protein n=1 Tax=Roseiconus lacunae TaxID=2605694 RepID=UPI003F533B8E
MYRLALIGVIAFVNAGGLLRSAETYYLSPTGNDSDPGTRRQPWKSLEKASQFAIPGSKIVLLPGTYPIAFSHSDHTILTAKKIVRKNVKTAKIR